MIGNGPVDDWFFLQPGESVKEGKVLYFIGKRHSKNLSDNDFWRIQRQKTERVKTLIHLFNQAQIPSVYCRDGRLAKNACGFGNKYRQRFYRYKLRLITVRLFIF